MEASIVILAGGGSRRMGRDKAQLTVNGQDLLTRTARIALSVCPRVVVIGRERPANWTLPAVTFYPDAAPGEGPLPALAQALDVTKTATILLPCDLPLLNFDALCWLLACERGPDGCAVRGEPLFSVYTKNVLPLVRVHIAAGELSLRELVSAGQFAHVDPPAWVSDTLVNVNTPADWARVLEANQ